MISIIERDYETAAAGLPADAVFNLLAPVPTPVRGTSVPAGGFAATAGNKSHTTDPSALALVERAWDGTSVGIAGGSQTGAGLNKRYSVTRGRPPRELSSGLPQA